MYIQSICDSVKYIMYPNFLYFWILYDYDDGVDTVDVTNDGYGVVFVDVIEVEGVPSQNSNSLSWSKHNMIIWYPQFFDKLIWIKKC